MCARFSPQQVSHAVERGCGCARARESAVKSSIAQSTAACTGPAFGGGPARRQPVPPQGAEARAFTGQRTMNTRGTRPGLSPTFYRWAEPSLTVQPLGTGRPLVISAVYRGPDFPRACSSSPDTDGVLQPRKSMTMFDLLAMEPAKAAPIPERNHKKKADPIWPRSAVMRSDSSRPSDMERPVNPRRYLRVVSDSGHATVMPCPVRQTSYAATGRARPASASTVVPIAQMKPKSSRPTAVTTCCLLFPRAVSVR